MLSIARRTGRKRAATHNDVPVAHSGTTFALGNGTSSGSRSIACATLGYATALFGDSDKPPQPPATELRAAGVSVFLWSGVVSTEMRIALDLPWDDLQQMLLLAVTLYDEQGVLDAVRERLQGKPTLPSVILDEWREAGILEADIRHAIGSAAHAKQWFKDIAKGEQLGEVVAAALPAIPTSDLAKTLKRLSDWVYAE